MDKGKKREVPDQPNSPPSPPQASTAAADPVASPPLKWGSMDAEVENVLPMLDAVPNDHPTSHRAVKGTDEYYHRQSGVHAGERTHEAATSGCPLLSLPAELLDSVLSYLSPYDLSAVSQMCRLLCTRATSDFHWQALVQAHIPNNPVITPYPCRSFWDLWVAHDPRWFLPKYKIWFSGQDLMGKIILIVYNQRRGCIEGYQLLAIRKRTAYEHWQADTQVTIHTFEPTVKLDLDKAVLRLPCDEKPLYMGTDRNEEFDENWEEAAGARGSSSIWARRRLDPHSLRPDPCANDPRRTPNRLAAEVPMAQYSSSHGMFSSFILARPLPQDEADACTRLGFPYADVWPPPAVPARHRVAAANLYRLGGVRYFSRGVVDRRPRRRSEMSDQSFRIRSWMETRPALVGALRRLEAVTSARNDSFGQVVQSWPVGPSIAATEAGATGVTTVSGSEQAAQAAPAAEDDDEAAEEAAATASTVSSNSDFFSRVSFPLGLHISEETTTYATLDPVLYTPTADCPWRGIWVGDYSGHGCEFLLINQVHDDEGEGARPEEAVVRGPDETDEAFEARRRDARIYRGRLEAIKLTGDPNVPRGEYTFVADDLGPKGFVSVIQDEPFKGARVVKSKGHVAGSGFRNDKFIQSQLMLISYDRLAQYWLGFGRISFFERADIDKLLSIT